MALNIWTQASGYSLGSFPENTQQEISLPVSSSSGITFKVISGELPPGLRLVGNKIKGSAYQVPRITTYEFCIRASAVAGISDRTFKITIEGESVPFFTTPAGPLDVNLPQQFFVLDSSYVNYQIEAYNTYTPYNNNIKFFIASGEGSLPPGLRLSESGLIYGLVEPAYSLKPVDGDGSFDNTYYDTVAFDFGQRPTNGYDSYSFDLVTFDYSLKAKAPKKLNRNYGFTVTITDGDNVEKRNFSIFVVGDDYFRADNETILNGTGLFTADNTYLRNPIWLTPSDLGTYRANNYVTVILDTYDIYDVFYDLEIVNAEVSMTSIKKTLTDNVIGGTKITIKNPSAIPQYGQYICFNNIIVGATSQPHQISAVTSLGNNEYRLTVVQPLEVDIPNNLFFYSGSLSQLPPGMSFDENTAEIFGVVPYQPAITKEYKFTASAWRLATSGEQARTPRVFTIKLQGEIESFITWVTPSDLGTANANFVSTLKVEATSTISTATILYTLESGRLPPGLSLAVDGEIIGKVTQYPTATSNGLTYFDLSTTPTSFDGGSTTFDYEYVFTVKAQDQLVYSATTRTFKIKIDTPNELVYSNITTKPFLNKTQRNYWKEFINDTTVFTPTSIYRPNDPNFGIQTTLSMMIYAGIETSDAAKYISAMGLNHKKKRFQFGSVKKATAILPGTRTEVYEVIYVEMIDPLEPGGKRLPSSIVYSPEPSLRTIDRNDDFYQPGYVKPNPTKDARMGQLGLDTGRLDPLLLSIDSAGYDTSTQAGESYFPNSISIWRERIKKWEDDAGNGLASERNYLPLWMRSIQPGDNQELDFQLAVPLCYCKIGAADDILLNIKFSGFDFKLLDYTVDRYIIDSVKGETADKYLVFKNDRITV